MRSGRKISVMAVRTPLLVAALLLVGAGVGLGLTAVNSEAAANSVEKQTAGQTLAEEQPAATAGVPATVQQAPTGEPELYPGTEEQAPSAQTIQLPTGENVTVGSEGDGEKKRETVSVVDGDVHVVDIGSTTYALPTDRDATLDRSLFDVEALRELDDRATLPVLIETDATPDAVAGDSIDVTRRLDTTGTVAAVIDRDEAAATLNKLIDRPAVDRVALDRQVSSPSVQERDDAPLTGVESVVPADMMAGNDSNATDGEGVTVAVVDTGIDQTHPDLEDRVVDRIDLLDDDRTGDPSGHGTAVAGILAGEGVADERAYEGVAPGVDVIDVRAMGRTGGGQAATVATAIERVVEDTDADILVLSAAVGSSTELQETTQWATEQGLIVVTSAGNSGDPRRIDAAGTVEEAITVGAYDHESGQVTDFSSRGPTLDGRVKPDVVARGTTVPAPASGQATDRTYRRMTGTSAAAPIVGGVVARLLAADPSLDASAVQDRLASTARPAPKATVYEQGGGRVALDQVLDPDVVVSPGTVSIGGGDGDRERILTVTNHDDRPHDIEFEPELSAVRDDADRLSAAAGGDIDPSPTGANAIELNRTSVSVAPGETAAVSLRVPEFPPGTYSGALSYQVDGKTRSVAIGVVDGGKVTVEREALSDTSHDPSAGELLVYNDDGTHEEIIDFENGTASFFAAGGTYNLWSTRTDGTTGTTVFVTEQRSFDGPETVVLDERKTVPVGPDPSGIEHRVGPMTAFSKTVSMTDTAGGRTVRWDVSQQRTDGTLVRATESNNELAINALLVPDRQRPSETPLAAPDVFHLAWGTDHITGERPYVSSPSLDSTQVTYGRQRADEELTVQHRADPADARLHQQRRDWSLGGVDTQRLHRFAAGESEYELRITGAGGTAVATPTVEQGVIPTGPAARTSVRAFLPVNHRFRGGQPYHGGLAIRDWTDRLALSTAPMQDTAGTALAATNGTATLAIDYGEQTTVRELEWPRDTVALPSVRPGDTVTSSLTATAPDATLSTRTYTDVTINEYNPDRRPPAMVTEFWFPEAERTGAVSGESTTLRLDGDGFDRIVDRKLWYAIGAPEAPPWEEPSAWNQLDATRDSGAVIGEVPLADHDLPTAQESDPLAIDNTAFDDRPAALSIAAAVKTVDGHRTRVATERAAHVGAAPDSRTVDIGTELVTRLRTLR